MTSRVLLSLGLTIALLGAPLSQALAASDETGSSAGKHDTAKGAALGAAGGHEVGSGHAVAGGMAGAAIGHHEKKKAQRNSQ